MRGMKPASLRSQPVSRAQAERAFRDLQKRWRPPQKERPLTPEEGQAATTKNTKLQGKYTPADPFTREAP